MKLYLIAIGDKMPSWVVTAYQDYASRLPKECSLILKALPAKKRSKNSDLARIKRDEAQALLNAVPKNTRLCALDVQGAAWDTPALSTKLADWLQDGRDMAFLVGGPEGLTPEVLKQCELRWSLSALTFPHPLVRVILAEQIFRAWSLLNNHPYHRE